MAFQSALDSTAYNALRGTPNPTFYADQLMCLWSNEVVFETTLAASPTGNSYAQVTFGSTISGNSANVEVGMRVIIGPNADAQDSIRRARNNFNGFDGRVHKAISGSTLFINETSAELVSGYRVYVIRDYPILEKLARVDSNVIYKDWDETFAQLPPIIGGLQSAYVDVVNASGIFTQAFAPTALAGTDGASISSWAWTIPAGGTITVGSASTQNITVEFTAGTYDVGLVVSDGTRSQTLHIKVFAIPANLSSVVNLGAAGADITRKLEDGSNASIVAFDGIEDVLDNTFVVIFDRAYYNGTETTVGGTNIRCVGRLRTESNTARPDEESSFLFETSFEIESPAAQLSRVTGPILTLKDDDTPTVWDQIDRATWWRVIAHVLQRHSTFLLSHSLIFSETTANYRLPVWGTNGSDLLSEINSLADAIGASMEFAPDGRVQINQRGTMLSTAGRAALTTVAALDNRDLLDLAIEIGHIQEVGLVLADGGSLNTNTGKVNVYKAHAPGTAWGSGVGRGPLRGQVLAIDQSKAAAEAELAGRVGHSLAEQNPTDILTVKMPDGYRWLIPSRSQWVTWELSEDDTNVRGLNYTTAQRWLCTSVSFTHNNEDGTGTVSATFQLETTGTEGEIIPPAPAPTVTNPTPAVPPVIGIPDLDFDWDDLIGPQPETPPPYWQEPIYPISPTTPPIDGNTVIVGTANELWWAKRFKTLDTEYIPNTPDLGAFNIRDGKFGIGTEFYLLVSDTDTSKVFYTANIFDAGAGWTEGETVSGDWDSVVPTSTFGAVYLYNADTGNTPEDFDADYWITKAFFASGSFASANSSAFLQLDYTFDQVYPGAVGILEDADSNATDGPIFYANNATPSGWYSTLWNARNGCLGAGTIKNLHRTVGYSDLPALFPAYNDFSGAVGQNLHSTRLHTSTTMHFIRLAGNAGCANTGHYDGRMRLIVDKSLQAFPGGGTPNACQTVYSTDYGATWGTIEDHGDPPGEFGGVDAVRIGDLLLLGTLDQVKQTDSGGGSSVYGTIMPGSGQPNALVIPRYEFNSVSASNASATPQYLVASVEFSGGTAAVWRATGTGGTFTDVTPVVSGTYGLAAAAECIAMPWRSGARIAGIFDMGGVQHLLVSTNAGSVWTDRGIVGEWSAQVTYRKGDTSLAELYYTDGRPCYSPNHGATLYTKAFPGTVTTDPVRFVRVFG